MHPKTTGLVLGKFLPLHKGHELLLRFAQNFVNRLYVVVDNIPDASIPGPLRCAWIRALIPDAAIFYLPKPNPQYPKEHSNFWEIWRKSLCELLPEKPDYLFASEEYGNTLATQLEAEFIPFDLRRQLLPISGTEIRQNPWKHWHYLSVPAKKYYLKRICIFGPESTGKTTLTRQLAQHYQTQWVPEYARFFIQSKSILEEKDMLSIAKGQIALENTYTETANNPILFCDTDALATTLWSQWLFGRCSKELNDLALTQHYDLYLLMSPDLKWENDEGRYLPEKGQDFFQDCVSLLNAHQRPFSIIEGLETERFEKALHTMEQFLLCLEQQL